jgi:hypothetical protein
MPSELLVVGSEHAQLPTAPFPKKNPIRGCHHTRRGAQPPPTDVAPRGPSVGHTISRVSDTAFLILGHGREPDGSAYGSSSPRSPSCTSHHNDPSAVIPAADSPASPGGSAGPASSRWRRAPRAYWKGYLKLSLVSCPVALFPASSEREKISFHQINEYTGNRLKYREVH